MSIIFKDLISSTFNNLSSGGSLAILSIGQSIEGQLLELGAAWLKLIVFIEYWPNKSGEDYQENMEVNQKGAYQGRRLRENWE